MLLDTQEQQQQSNPWINISIRDGKFMVKDKSLADYLMAEEMIDLGQYKKIKDKNIPLTFVLSRIIEDEFQESHKLKLIGTSEIGEAQVNVSISVGLGTVPARYILTGLLLSENPFKQVTLKLDPVKSQTGRLITKVWVSSDGTGLPAKSQPEEAIDKLKMLHDLFPDKVAVLESVL